MKNGSVTKKAESDDDDSGKGQNSEFDLKLIFKYRYINIDNMYRKTLLNASITKEAPESLFKMTQF